MPATPAATPPGSTARTPGRTPAQGAPVRGAPAGPRARSRWGAPIRFVARVRRTIGLLSRGALRVWVLLAALAVVAVQTPLVATVDEIRVGAALAISLAHAGSLAAALWRPRWAVAASVAAATVLMLVSPRGSDGLWPWGVTPMIVQCLVIAVVGLVAGWATAAACFTASVVVPGVLVAVRWRGHEVGASLSDLLLFVSIAASVLVLTVALAGRVRVGAELVRQQRVSADEHAQRLVVEERARIARELHDVVAHTMSLISVQARSAVYRLDGVPPSAAAEFDDIADRAKDALHQMRGVLAVLRTDADAGAREPQRGLDDIPELVARVRDAGQDVALTWQVPAGLAVPAVAGLGAHRIVQEALSNVMRHAADLPVEVSVQVLDDELVVGVENVLLAPVGDLDGGQGLVGMRERALAAGGTLECGPTPEGDFRVVARLPLRSVPRVWRSPVGDQR